MSLAIIGHGDILDDPCRVLVCPVNCVPGVMGKGLAYQFARRWPRLRDKHRDACNREAREFALRPGKVAEACVLDTDADAEIGIITFVLFAATKDHYRHPSRMEWAAGCVDALIRFARETEFTADRPAVALPALGCGEGGLSWLGIAGVAEMMREKFLHTRTLREVPDVEWRVYSPKGPR